MDHHHLFYKLHNCSFFYYYLRTSLLGTSLSIFLISAVSLLDSWLRFINLLNLRLVVLEVLALGRGFT